MTPITWLTIFLALVAISILIQTGIMLGVYLGLRRFESLFERWEPKLQAKIIPMASLVEHKTHTYEDNLGRAMDRLAFHTQRVGLALSSPLQNTNRTIQTIDRRFLHPLAEIIPLKKKAAKDRTKN